jgi:ribose transport system permease protein
MRKELGLFVLLLLLCLVTAWQSPAFLSPVNLQNTANQIGMFGIFSIGIGFVIITGGIDLSVGSAMALFGVVLSVLLNEKGWNSALGIVTILLLGAVIGLFHAGLITRARMQPFIVTLCGLLLYRGLARYVANDESKGFSDVPNFDVLQEIFMGQFLGVPKPFLLLIIISIAMWFVLHRSVYGRHLFAVGSNEEAARYAGINTRRVIATAYVICSVLTAISGIYFVFFTPSIAPSNHADFFELYGIAAAVLGGCSLRGGEGSIVGILLGTVLLRVLQNIVNLLSIPSSMEFAIIGVVILTGILADQLLKNRPARV